MCGGGGEWWGGGKVGVSNGDTMWGEGAKRQVLCCCLKQNMHVPILSRKDESVY